MNKSIINITTEVISTTKIIRVVAGTVAVSLAMIAEVSAVDTSQNPNQAAQKSSQANPLVPMVPSAKKTSTKTPNRSPKSVRQNTSITVRNPIPKDVSQRIQAALARTAEVTRSARQLYNNADYAAAEAECMRALAISPRINGNPIGGRAQHLLGQIYLEQGRNQEAIQCFLTKDNGAVNATSARTGRVLLSSEMALDVALAYTRLGDISSAKRYYSDRAALQYLPDVSPDDLPGQGNRVSLEASILFAKGLNASLEGRNEDAIRDYAKAHELAARNPLISFFHGKSLVNLRKNEDALPHFARAATYGKGEIVNRAKRYMSGFTEDKRARAMQGARLEGASRQ